MIRQAVRLVIPGEPPLSLNQQERMHWAARKRLRDWWAAEAWKAWLAAGRPRFRRAAVRYCLYYSTGRRRDADNCIASCKPILDGLRGHAFEDDHVRAVTILPPVVGCDRRRPRVEIEITELEGETV